MRRNFPSTDQHLEGYRGAMAGLIAGLPILYEGDGWFALNKPSGLPVHRGYTGERRTLVDLLRREISTGIHPVHRLDRGTSGILLIARHPEIARIFQEYFSERRVHKLYSALARGVVPNDIVIDYAIPTGPERDAVRANARTRIRCLDTIRLPDSPLYEPRYSLILAEPETGRFHQVRRHMSHIAHPLLGDSDHGRPEHNRLLKARVSLQRLALHAAVLRFPHPTTGVPLELRAPLPEDFTVPLQKMGFDLQRAFSKVELEGLLVLNTKSENPC